MSTTENWRCVNDPAGWQPSPIVTQTQRRTPNTPQPPNPANNPANAGLYIKCVSSKREYLTTLHDPDGHSTVLIPT
jgi:hypothetical protein